MKRMSEVFKLPLSTDFDFDHDWSAEDNGDDICLSGFDPIASGNKVVLLAVASSKTYGGIDSKIADISQHAAHAINNVDALADALEDVVKAWRFLCACNGYDEDHLVEFENAKKALQAYRGAK